MPQPISFVPAKPGESVAALPPDDGFPIPTTPHPLASTAAAPATLAAAPKVSAPLPPVGPTPAPQRTAPIPESAREQRVTPPVMLPKEPALIAPADKKTSVWKIVKTIAKIVGAVVVIALLAVAGLYYWGSKIAAEEGNGFQTEVLE